MKSEEIKDTTTMYTVLERCGLKANRSGMMSCPFHGADRRPSMKIYKDGYNCFACGSHGDVFGFVMEYEHVDFPTAFQILGGSYSSGTKEERKKASIMVRRRKLQAESRKLRKTRKELYAKQLNTDITECRELLEKQEPMSDAWADTMHKLCRLLQMKEWEDTYGIQQHD